MRYEKKKKKEKKEKNGEEGEEWRRRRRMEKWRSSSWERPRDDIIRTTFGYSKMRQYYLFIYSINLRVKYESNM